MSNPLRTAEDYELFIYTLTDKFLSIHRSTVTFVRLGQSLGRIAGELFFAHGRVHILIINTYLRILSIIEYLHRE
jgi:hypothetical protein